MRSRAGKDADVNCGEDVGGIPNLDTRLDKGMHNGC
jgi:hypothetical protein